MSTSKKRRRPDGISKKRRQPARKKDYCASVQGDTKRFGKTGGKSRPTQARRVAPRKSLQTHSFEDVPELLKICFPYNSAAHHKGCCEYKLSSCPQSAGVVAKLSGVVWCRESLTFCWLRAQHSECWRRARPHRRPFSRNSMHRRANVPQHPGFDSQFRCVFG